MQDVSHLGCSESSVLISCRKKHTLRRFLLFLIIYVSIFFQGWPGFFGPTGVAGPVGDKV